jgi:S1-C subfamily serine protease
MSSSFDSGVERDNLLLEINRQPVESVADFKRIAGALKPGDVIVLYVFAPALDQHQLKTVRVEGR